MKCPRDGTELSPVVANGVQLDKCHQCDGIWFDHGELKKLIALKQTNVEQRLESDYGNPSVSVGETKGFMRCPRCDDGRLQKCIYSYLRQVEIDRCEECFGMWLDKHELDSILGDRRDLDQIEDRLRLSDFFGKLMSAFPTA
jgi:Zn-finger nucleic acid-binding protein